MGKNRTVPLILGWYFLTFAAFYLSERFKDTDLIMYPAIFVLLGAMLVGPGAIAVYIIKEKQVTDKRMKTGFWCCAYVICWISFRIISLACFRLHLFG